MPLVGVILKVVTSTGRTLDKLFDCFLLTTNLLTLIKPFSHGEPGTNDHTIAAR